MPQPYRNGLLRASIRARPGGEVSGHYNADDFAPHLKEMFDDGSFTANADGVWINHREVNLATGEVEDKHFWLVEHDGETFLLYFWNPVGIQNGGR